MEVQLVPKGAITYVYKCPYEGPNCSGGKHCHALQTTVKLKNSMTVVMECLVRKKAKIAVEIGKNPIEIRI